MSTPHRSTLLRSSGRRQAVAAIGLAAVLALTTACGSQHAGGTHASVEHPSASKTSPSPLSLASTAGTPAVPAGKVTVAAALPTSVPDAASAYRLGAGPADAAKVTALARTLGITAAPRHTTGRWTATSSAGLMLQVLDSAGQRWTTSGPGTPGLPVCVAARCAFRGDTVPGDTGADPLPARGRAAQAARSIMAKVLAATARSGDPVVVAAAGTSALAAAEHRVGGLLAVGFGTQVSVGADGHVFSGSGWLGTPAAMGRYQLIGAADAIKRLPQDSGGMHPDFCVRTAEGGTCAGRPLTVTGAYLGLLLVLDTHGASLLVPAWLLSVQGQSAPLAVVAVTDAQLATPRPPATPTLASATPGTATATPITPSPSPTR